MPPTVIKIQGRASINTVAERAALLVDVSDSGYDKNTVAQNVVNTVSYLQSEIDQLCFRLDNGDISPHAPVSFYSIASLSTSSQDEYDEHGHRTGKETQTAQTKLDIRFRDFVKLGEMVVQLSATPFVHLQGINWKLTDEKQALLDEEVRLNALRQAIQRARAYAQVIGRETVTPVKIDDSEEHYPRGLVMQTARKATSTAAFGVGGGIDFEPQVIVVSATLEVEFHAE